MIKNIRVLIVCENKKQTEQFYKYLESKLTDKNVYIDTCYYHGEEKAVMIEEQTDSKNALSEATETIVNHAKDANVNIKHFTFESGF
jgi:hypothetical protein